MTTLDSPRLSVSVTAVPKNAMTNNSSRVATGSINFVKDTTLTSGVGASQANKAWEYVGSLAEGESVVLDLSTFEGFDLGAGEGNDMLGMSMEPLFEIVAIAVSNENAVSANGKLEIEPDSTYGFQPIGYHNESNEGYLRGGGVLYKQQPASPGFEITFSSKKILFKAVDGSVSFKVVIIGRHDDDISSVSSDSSSSSESSSSSS